MPSIEELVGQLGKPQAEGFQAYKALEETVTRATAPGNDQECAEAAAGLAGELGRMTEAKKDDKGRDIKPRLVHGSEVRTKIARLLSFVAGQQEVPALAGALKDLDVREMARFALDRRRSPAATAALVKALDEEVGPEFRAGIVAALGECPCPEAMAAVKKATGDENKPVRIAAVEALANYADPSCDALIARATKADCARCRCTAHKARVRYAANLASAGNKSAARQVYKAICASDAPAPQKRAAEAGLNALV